MKFSNQLNLFLICVIVNQCFCALLKNGVSKMTQTNPSQPLFLTDEQIKELLSWDTLIPGIESVMRGVSQNKVIQPARLVMKIEQTPGVVLSMPGYVKDDTGDTLAVKIVTSFPNNKQIGLPSILATVLLYNPTTGKLKAVMEGTEITKWRTAGASVVATKHLFKRSSEKDLIVAILGSGTQGEIHARAFYENFNLKQIKIWNHHLEGAESLVKRLNIPIASVAKSKEECVADADIIVTATYTSVPIVQYSSLSKNKQVHINAVGAGMNHHSELDSETYAHSSIFFDAEPSARNELKGLYDQFPENMIGEVGQFIEGNIKPLKQYNVTIFHSMGMASEDVISAKLVYAEYCRRTKAC